MTRVKDDIELLKRIADFEKITPQSQYPLGWNWQQVKIWPSTLSRLVVEGYLEVVFSSNSYTGYRLTEMGKALIEEALASPSTDEVLELPQDIFEPIEGYQDLKEIVLKVLKADRPVHLLFTGVPASAKTMFLMELSRVKGSVYILGSQSTKAGIAETLFALRPRLLLVDEIDRIGTKDIAVLLSLAETGIVSETKYSRRREIRLTTKVFAASNSLNMPTELISRFMVFHFKPYTREEFMKVAKSILVKRENVDEDLASYIAEEVWRLPQSFPDPRQAVRIARLAQSKEEVVELIEALRRFGRLS